MSPWNVADGDEIDASGFRTVDAKVIDLALVAASRDLRGTMVCVTVGRLKDHRTGPESSCLALHSRKAAAVFDNEVVTSVLSEGQENPQASHSQCEHHSERRPISYVFRVV